MSDSRFVYVTYIRTTPEKLWQALTDPQFTQKYFAQTRHESDWTPGASWRMVKPDGSVTDAGEVLEIEPKRRLVLKWRNEYKPELKAEGFSRMTYELDPKGEMVKLTVIHEIGHPDSKLIHAVSGGWPIILSSLKSFLETGQALEATQGHRCAGADS
jgi:uncharacterized protein YndB with AHSA1/START domain